MTIATNIARRIAALVLPSLLGIALAECGLDQLTGGNKVLELALSADTTVVLGATKTLVPSAVDGTPLPAGLQVTWTSAAPLVATVSGSGVVTALGEGSSKVTATITSPELPPEGLSVSRTVVVGYGGIVMAAIDSLTGLGQSVTPLVRGVDASNAAVATVAATLTSSDPTVAAVLGSAIVAKKNGTVTVTATYGGHTAQVSVKVRQVAKRIVFGVSPFVFKSLGHDTSVTIQVLDTRDSLVAAPGIAWTTLNPAVATVSVVGVMRALQVAATTVRATVDTVVASLPVSVSQAISTLTKSAGDAQSQTAGVAVAAGPTVTVKDAGAFGIAGVPVTFAVAGGGGSITGAAQTTDAQGNATVGSWTLGTTAGANSLSATAGGLSVTFTATGNPGAPAALTVQQAPTISNANTVGAALTPSIQIGVRDANGNVVTAATTTVSLAISTNPGSATIGGTTSVAAVNGIATFANVTLSAPGLGFVLTASATGLTGVATPAFNVTGPATKLAYTVLPANVVAGSGFGATVKVAIQDAAGTTLTSATNNVTIAIGANPGTGTLSGTATQAAVAGVATFSGLSINKTGTGYTLVASASGLTGATSSAFNVTPGAAAKLAFVQQPTNTAPAVAIAPAVTVAILDALDNVVTTSTATVALAIGAGAGSGTLAGTTSVAAVAGIATFSTLQINNAFNGYTLVASATSLTSATSPAFNILGPGTARALKFVTQPSNAVAGAVNAPSITVKVVDSVGTTVNTSSASITLALAANAAGGTLSGTLTATATGGVATFNNVRLNRVGAGYAIAASSSGLTADTSTTFAISVGAASKLLFTVQPSSTTATAALAPSVVVSVTDAQDNVVSTATNTITVGIGANPGGSTLAGTVSIAATNGVATFPNLSLGASGTGYTLTASATGLTAATSSAFNITTGAPQALVFVTQPTSVVAGAAIAPAMTLKVVDNVGATVTSPVFVVSLSVGAGSGTTFGTIAVNTVNGVASFSNVRINNANTGYTLVASAASLTSATSGTFDVTVGPAAALAFTVPPGNTPFGAQIAPPVQVAVTDIAGNVIQSAANTITLGIGTNPGAATLAGTTALAATGGVAVFSTLSLNAVGAGYTLSATSPGLTTATSPSFDVTAGTPRTLVFVTGPSTTGAGVAVAPAITVKVVDSAGTTVPSPVFAVTLAFGANPNGGTLSGTLTANTANGVATFSNVKVNRTGAGYTLVASASSLTSATSGVFAISTGPASKLLFAVQPTAISAGAVIAPSVQVSITDAQDNVVTTATNTITVTIGSNPGASTLGGTAQAAAVAGVSTFSSLTLNKIASGYTLNAAATGLTGATSGAFNVTAGAPAVLDITTQPANVAVGAIMSAVVVTVRDAGGNAVTGATTPVTLSLLNNPVGALLGGTPTVNAVNGVATFSTLTIDKAGQALTLLASATSLVSDTSSAFNAIGPVTALFFTTPPVTTIRNGVMANVVIEGRDAAGNRSTAASNPVTLAIGNNPAAGALGGTLVRNLSAGIATFSNLTIDDAGLGYTLSAAATGVTGATSSAFDINAFGPANKLAFVIQPSNADAGVALSPDIQVAVQDISGNTVTNSTASITLTFGANPGLATLGGQVTVNAVAGVATFTGISVSAAGAGYTLSASTSSLTSAISTTFNIVVAGQAVRLAFQQQPGTTTSGSVVSPGIQVTAVNSSSQVVTSFTGTIILTIASGPAGGTIGGTVSIAATNGVATFSTITIPKTGTYTVRAATGGLTSASSNSFVINPGSAAKLGFLTTPPSVVAGLVMPGTIQVAVQDAQGNTVPTASNTITLDAMFLNGGNPTVLDPFLSPQYRPALAGNLSAAAVNGVASFTGVRPRSTPTQLLEATAPGLATGLSPLFTVTAAPASQLSLYSLYYPQSGLGFNIVQANAPFTVLVTILDSLGNDAGDHGEVVTLSIGANPSGGVISGVTSMVRASSISGYGFDFTQVQIDKTGTGYTVVASAPGLTSVITPSFNVVTGSPVQLAFGVQPGATQVNTTISPAVTVEVRDDHGNLVTSAAGTVTLALSSNPGGATLGGAKTATLAGGIATFSNLTLSAVASAYSLRATTTVSGVTGTFLSAPFNITP